MTHIFRLKEIIKLTHFNELPDFLDKSTLKNCFINFLITYANNTNSNNVSYVLEELLELADRQWHTYELLDNDVKNQLEKYIINILDFENEEIMDYIMCIIPRIGLKKVYDYIVNIKDSITNCNVKKILEESISEYGDSVSDPYSGMTVCGFKE